MSDSARPVDLVTVVVPAFNADQTLHETLVSVRGQTHANLEIIVVDDGSTDATAAIAARHAAADDRIRLIRQENGGVARARNRGIAEASAAYVAPVDGDDLWAPTKIAKQLVRLKQADAGLSYTWYAVIDEQSNVIHTISPSHEGDVLGRLCEGNFVGNGSSPLMLKTAVLDAGGYDASLRDRKAQGCEDYQLYLRIAERRTFAVVPEFLTGYRQTQSNMSSDASQMLRSWDLVTTEILARHPRFHGEMRRSTFWFLWWLFQRAVRAGRVKVAARLLTRMTSNHFGDTARAFLDPSLTWRRHAHAMIPWSRFVAQQHPVIERHHEPESLRGLHETPSAEAS